MAADGWPEFMEKKARLGADCVGQPRNGHPPGDGSAARVGVNRIPRLAAGPLWRDTARQSLVRIMLISEGLLPEFAAFFRGLSEAEIDELMQSFLFRNCTVRQELADTLAAYAK